MDSYILLTELMFYVVDLTIADADRVLKTTISQRIMQAALACLARADRGMP